MNAKPLFANYVLSLIKLKEQAMSDELKPCPFCGGEAGYGSLGNDKENWSIWCEYCPMSGFDGGDLDELKRIWNTRPRGDALEAESKKLKKYIGMNDIKHTQKEKTIASLREELETVEKLRLYDKGIAELTDEALDDLKEQLDEAKRGSDLAVVLLKEVRSCDWCPECTDGSGGRYDEFHQPVQCQFCHEADLLIAQGVDA